MRQKIVAALLALVLAVGLIGSVSAADTADTANTVTLDNGLELTKETDGKSWTVTKYDGKEENIVIPALHDNIPVEKIGEAAFAPSTTFSPEKQLTTVTIPGTVETVGNGAFKGCDSLNTVIFQDYISETGVQRNATIGESAFEGCDGLRTLMLSCNIKKISTAAFKDCKHLSSVVIPWGVQKIEATAFAGCIDLQDITIFDPVVDIDKAFNLDSATLKTIHCVEGDLYNKLVNRMKAYPDKLHALTGKTEPQIVTQASCTQEGSIKVSYTCTYKKEITEPIKDKDGNATGETKVIDTKYCDLYGKTEHSETRKTSLLPHTPVAVDDVEPTCATPGYTNKTICSVCKTQLTGTEDNNLKAHTYDDNSPTVERTLFEGHCAKDDAGTPGLILITRKCAVCGHTPVCYDCKKLELALKEANAVLETARKELDDATAKAEAAQAAKDKADADVKDAEKAVTEATEAQTAAQTALDAAAAKVTETQTKLETAVTDEDKAAARKELEEAKAAADKASDALIDAKIVKANADKAKIKAEEAVDAAQAAKSSADTIKGKKQAAWDTAKETVSTEETNLKNHVEASLHNECAECSQMLEAIAAAKSDSEKAKANAAYATHQGNLDAHKPTSISVDAIDTDEIAVPAHQWGEDYEKVTIPAICTSNNPGEKQIKHKCKICGKEETVDTVPIRPAKEHTPPSDAEYDITKPATCTEKGKKAYKPGTKCVVCEQEITGTLPIPKLDHTPPEDLKETVTPATCTEPGEEGIPDSKCTVCGETIKGTMKPISALGHKWENFEPKDGQDATQAEDCHEKTVTGTVSCERCGESMEQEITIPGKLEHTWGEWAPDPEDSTKEIRTCTVCKEATETRNASTNPGTTTPSEPDDPSTDDPDDPSGDDKPSGGDNPGTTTPEKTSYNVTLIQSSNGSVSASRNTAESGDSVTLTVWADSGYELDQIWVTTASGSTRNLTSLGGNQYRFTMPASAVEVRVSFSKRASSSSSWSSSSSSSSSSTTPVQTVVQSVPRAVATGQRFSDVPASHWAAGEINWANQMGYMNGGRNGFNPDGNITFQQLWMVLARLTGSRPASMEDARRWAVNGGFAEGAAPNGSVSRHQLVTALYRCAHLMGSTNRNTTSLAGYPDSRIVPAVARDAFSWAVANGIIGGNSSGRLDPNGTLTRAQFCVILYRFSQRI